MSEIRSQKRTRQQLHQARVLRIENERLVTENRELVVQVEKTRTEVVQVERLESELTWIRQQLDRVTAHNEEMYENRDLIRTALTSDQHRLQTEVVQHRVTISVLRKHITYLESSDRDAAKLRRRLLSKSEEIRQLYKKIGEYRKTAVNA